MWLGEHLFSFETSLRHLQHEREYQEHLQGVETPKRRVNFCSFEHHMEPLSYAQFLLFYGKQINSFN